MAIDLVFIDYEWPLLSPGICCGHFLMPFWTFFGATLIGKAVIKVNMQAGMLVSEVHKYPVSIHTYSTPAHAHNAANTRYWVLLAA